jgi:hypothetical protein
MKKNLFVAAAVSGLMLVAGCNNAPITKSPVDLGAVPAEAKAILKPNAELLGAEEWTYSGGKKALFLRYKTAEGITETVEVDSSTYVSTPATVFEPK